MLRAKSTSGSSTIAPDKSVDTVVSEPDVALGYNICDGVFCFIFCADLFGVSKDHKYQPKEPLLWRAGHTHSTPHDFVQAEGST